MKEIVFPLLSFLASLFRSRFSMQLEILALRHQLAVYHRRRKRPIIKPADRLLWAWLSKLWAGWRNALVFAKPETVITWQRRKFREYWARLSHSRGPGRPKTASEVRDLIRRISSANPIWGTPRIVAELRKLGIEVSKATVDAYRMRRPGPPSGTWRTFLKNHINDLICVDFFTVPTVRFKVLFVFLVLSLHRRVVLHFNVTEHPTTRWTAQQIVEAFPEDAAPRYMIRDRDAVYGDLFRRRIKNMCITEVITAPRSPWQSPYVERLVGSIRRECLDHVIVLNENHLRRILKSYFSYYHTWRTHLSLDLDCPEPRAIQPPTSGVVIEIPEVSGLHHHYERLAA
jgi:putative transposase